MTYTPTLRRLNLDQLLITDTGALEWSHLESLIDGHTIDRRPLDVRQIDVDHFRIVRGHHRYIAALVRGDHDIACKVIL